METYKAMRKWGSSYTTLCSYGDVPMGEVIVKFKSPTFMEGSYVFICALLYNNSIHRR